MKYKFKNFISFKVDEDTYNLLSQDLSEDVFIFKGKLLVSFLEIINSTGHRKLQDLFLKKWKNEFSEEQLIIFLNSLSLTSDSFSLTMPDLVLKLSVKNAKNANSENTITKSAISSMVANFDYDEIMANATCNGGDIDPYGINNNNHPPNGCGDSSY